MRRRRPCLDCNSLTRNPSRCDTCQATWQARQEQIRGSSTQRGYGSRWRRTAAAAVAGHRAVQGNWCPGHGIPAHHASDLTADHIVPKACGGSDDPENVAVLCRSCNARKHAS
ncbi:HNH endonuclease [Kitasatospora sp. NBC_01266]|uniref:HNH endonuclease n=1 Tax=Kitasatospora sp. NBC_01266 TaxID=2903572 RepID=UPI002E347056|nr:HNH endonuclease signature motif containing protein [Kitasatospora sp. NBC_01266]